MKLALAMIFVMSLFLLAACSQIVQQDSMMKKDSDSMMKDESNTSDSAMMGTNDSMNATDSIMDNTTDAMMKQTADEMMKWSAENFSGIPSKEELKKMLTPIQYKVTQENGTETPFNNEFWNNEREGIYVDIVSGEPLFSSTDKFDSGTGWPSFTKPLVAGDIVEDNDYSLGSVRTEVRSKYANSHLGHVFDDGPAPTGLRYCMNSAAMRFIPKEDLEKEGYGNFANLFKGNV